MAESQYRFERLTPTDDVDLSIYEDAIDYVFDNSDIRNVAISGAYSAGKSSVLASYKKKHRDLHFLHISLAHFVSPDKEDEQDVKESVLEGKILNQLIHQISPDKIPQTNFRVKKKINSKSIVAKTLETVALLVAVLYFVLFDSWKAYVLTLPNNQLKSFLKLSIQPYALLIDGIVIIGILGFLIYGLIKVQKNKNVFRKLNLQGNEIEIFEESDDSYFDKYLNEVLYLFENAEADVIVFEDMDRFNANRIFERLREVNTLANIQLQQDNKKILRFFYLLRDDIFISKDRTKFFDYIVPVVPVIDSSNSYGQFIDHFEKSGLLKKFDESFLQGLSLYIDDMRLLKNIHNEFVIYYNRLNTTELDCNKMLAIIAYKNLFPRDFADLQLNQGFVFTLFNKKETFIESEIAATKEIINETQRRISSLKNEELISMRELNAVFADRYLSGYRWNQYGDNELADFILRNLNGNIRKEYDSRKQALEDKIADNCTQLTQEVYELEHKLIAIKSKQLHQIVTRDNIDEIFSITNTNEIGEVTDFNDIKSSEYFDLLKYLIRNGYIDETYADYMTYFYENSLSRIDKTFLRSVTDKKAKEYTYQLKSPQMVVSRLRLVDFDQEEILNFDLLTFLLCTQSYTEYLERFLKQLKDTENFKFIGAYFDTTNEMPAFIKCLNAKWTEIFNLALRRNGLTEQQIRQYSIFSIYYSDDNIIKNVNEGNCLCDYISNADDYLAINNPNIDKLIHGFKLLGVSFKSFNYDVLNKELFNAVYEKSLYEINANNLQLIMTKVLGIEKNEDIIHKNYTILCSYPDSEITQYIDWNINEYFDVILQMSNGTINDDEEVVITVLNNQDLYTEYKKSYISVLQTTIDSIKEVTDSTLWPSLLDSGIIKYSEQNIIDYYNVLKLDKSVIAFINKGNNTLNFSKGNYDDDIKKVLFSDVVECDSIKDSKYKQILTTLRRSYTSFSIENISFAKMNILIDAGIIKMTVDNLKFLRENYPEHKYLFIKKNIAKYIEIMSDELFSQEELLKILDWDISDEVKISLLKFSNGPITVVNKNYSTPVCVYILDNNLEHSDLRSLFSSFEQWQDLVQDKIFDYAIDNIASIINNADDVSKRLLDELFCAGQLDKDAKINLLIALMPTANSNRIKEILVLLKLDNYIKIFDARTKPQFEISNESEKLLKAFRENGFIQDYMESSENEGYYTITRIKPTKTLSQELL